MTTRTIVRVNNVEIEATNDALEFVTIKPICEALGIGCPSQIKKIKEHPSLKDHWTLIRSTSKDGKRYEMFALPLKYVYGWLFTINPLNVPVDKRSLLKNFSDKYYLALYGLTVKDKRSAAYYKRQTELADKMIESYEEIVYWADVEIKALEQLCDTYKNLLRMAGLTK